MKPLDDHYYFLPEYNKNTRSNLSQPVVLQIFTFVQRIFPNIKKRIREIKK